MSYDPSIAKWTTEDPEGYVNGPNEYQMELDNPVSLLDPIGTQTQPATAPTTQPSGSIFLPGGPKESAGSTEVDIPGVGQVILYGVNNNNIPSGGSAVFAAKLRKTDGCPCTKLTWSQKVKITINNRQALTDDQYYLIANHETSEHGGNDPFKGFVLDNGYRPSKIPPNPGDPFAPPPGYLVPNEYQSELGPIDWPDESHPFAPGDIAVGDWPSIPWSPLANRTEAVPYPPGTDVTKDFTLTLYCDGKPIGPQIQWSVQGVAGSGQYSTVKINVGPQ